MIKHTGTVTIESENIILRRFTLDDAEQMFNNWASIDAVTKNLPWNSHRNIEKTKFVINTWMKYYKKENYYNWCIESKSSGEVLGSICLSCFDEQNSSCEAGYCLGYEFWNKGIMTETLNLVINHAFNSLKCKSINSKVYYENIQSCRVLKKCGFKFLEIKRSEGREYKYFLIKRET